MFMKARDRIVQAARKLVADRPVEEISLAELARISGVSWPTVRRHVGGRQGLPDFLEAAGLVPPGAAALAGSNRPAVDNRSRILQAALRCFAARGYSGATLDDVAAEAGLTKGAIYWYFASKDDLCMELIEERFRAEANRLPLDIQKAAREGGNEAALRAFLAHEVTVAREAEPWRQIGLEFMSRSRNPALRGRYAELAQSIYRDTIPVVEALVAGGVITRDLDPRAVAVVWRCLLLGMGLWMTQDPKGLDFEKMAGGIAEVMWHGMAPGSQDTSEPAAGDGKLQRKHTH